MRLELYHPPYLFRGPRPSIEYVSPKWTYGGAAELRTPEAEVIKWVHLIHPMTTTHSLDTEQLHFHRHGGCHVSVEVSKEATLAPPGWYMLFIVDHHAVPSTAKWIHLPRT